MSHSKVNKKFGIKSKIICKYFILGKCIKGENCPYLHSQIDQSKDRCTIECPMYSIGYCKNGPICHFIHIKKDSFSIKENEKNKLKEKESNISNIKEKEKKENKIEIMDEEDDTSSTPLAEDFIDDSETEKKEDKHIKNSNQIFNGKNEKREINNNLKNNKENEDKELYEIPIWYLEHYYDKPISMIFSDLEKQNLPEVIALQKKYGFYDKDTSQIIQPLIQNDNLNMNTLNLNFNNFNMNFDLNNNITNFSNINSIYSEVNYNQNNNYLQNNYYQRSEDDIEFIINKDINIYYYLIKLKKYREVKKSYESNIIELPEKLFNQYKNINLLFNDLTIIIIIYNYESKDFEGFAQLEYPIFDDNSENASEENKNLFKIEWLWKTKMHYSEVRHLMNKADHDHFLNQSKNGCPLHKDLGNYLCRLMIKRLTREEEIELINEKHIFQNQMKYYQYLKNLKQYENELDENYYKIDYNKEESYFYEEEEDDEDNEYYYNNINDNYFKGLKTKKYKENFINNDKYKYNDLSKSNYRTKYKSFESKFKGNEISYRKKHKRKSKNHNRNSINESIRRSQNKKRRRSRSSYYEDEEKNYYRETNIKDYSSKKHKKYRENKKKIYSQVNKEEIITLK